MQTARRAYGVLTEEQKYILFRWQKITNKFVPKTKAGVLKFQHIRSHYTLVRKSRNLLLRYALRTLSKASLNLARSTAYCSKVLHAYSLQEHRAWGLRERGRLQQ